MFSKEELIDELDYIDAHFEFSVDCSEQLEEHLLDEGLVEFVDDIPMLTYAGQIEAGYSKDDIKDMYTDEEIGESYE